MNNEIFSSSRNIGFTVGIFIIIVLTILLIWWAMKPSWVPLLGIDSNLESRTEVLQHLMEWGIPFKEDESTGQILVNQSQVVGIRNRLSETGALVRATPGMEIFNESEYGMSEFTQRINYQRAIEGEIAQTIRSFADVKSARVHLTLPKQSIFRDKQSQPKASVVIEAKPGQVISEDQVFGITKLVAASIDDLTPGNVTVLDHNGLILSSDGENPSVRKQHSSRNLEMLYANRARELVRGIVQTDNIKVAVNTEINLDRIKSVKDQIIPSDSSSGFLHKTKRQTVSNSDSQPDSRKAASGEKTSVVEEEFLFSRERSEIEYASGQIKFISVGIVVVKDITPEVISDIEKVVASGLGLNIERGDKITVVSVLPQTTESLSPVKASLVTKTTPTNKSSTLQEYLANRFNIVVASLVLGIVFLSIAAITMMRRQSRSTREQHLSPEEQERLLQDIRAWISKEHRESI